MGRGATYSNSRYTVYEHGVYRRGSVLHGRGMRVWLDDFETLDDALAAYPDAEPCFGSTTWRHDSMMDLPGEDDPTMDAFYEDDYD